MPDYRLDQKTCKHQFNFHSIGGVFQYYECEKCGYYFSAPGSQIKTGEEADRFMGIDFAYKKGIGEEEAIEGGGEWTKS